MSSLSVRSARAAHGSPRDDFAATVARELAAQRPASARPAPRAGERDVERLSMAPVEQYDWEEVANELQAENDRLETALAQTRMRADKKLKQLNVLRDELAEFDEGERERAGGDEWFLAWALPPTVEAALAPHSKAPVAAKKTPVPPPAAAEGAARSFRAQAMKSKWLGAGTKVQDRVKSARTARPTPKAPPSTPPAQQQRPKSARTSIPQRVAVLIEQLSGVERAVELAEEERAKLEFLEARAAAQANASGEGSDGARTELARLRVLAVDGSAHSRQMKAQRDEEMNRRDGDKELHERARELRRQKLGERKRQHKDAKWVAQRMQPPELRPPVPDGSAHAERSPTGATPRGRRPSAEKNELAIRVMQMGHVLEASELALLRGAPPLRRPSLAPSEPESTLIDDHAARLEALGIALTPEEALAEVRRRLDARAEAEALVNDADANLQRRPPRRRRCAPPPPPEGPAAPPAARAHTSSGEGPKPGPRRRRRPPRSRGWRPTPPPPPAWARPPQTTTTAKMATTTTMAAPRWRRSSRRRKRTG